MRSFVNCAVAAHGPVQEVGTIRLTQHAQETRSCRSEQMRTEDNV
jgi:hypothetical protein